MNELNDFEALRWKVLRWADAREIFKHGTPEGQALKTIEEANELLAAIRAHDRDEIIDAIGDVLVTVIIQAEMQDIAPQACLRKAYEVISKRTGKMKDGVFVKDEAKS